jgi:N-acetylmuramoyl-L-alanine amidase
MTGPLQSEVRYLGNTQYLPVIKLCEAYGLSWEWDEVARVATIKGGRGKISLLAGSDKILINGHEENLGNQAVLYKSALYVPASFVKYKLGKIMAVKGAEREEAGVTGAEPQQRYAIRAIVIDPGHGGNDPGAISRRYRLKEKDLNLYVARRLRDLLDKRGIRVTLTRDKDTFISLEKRAEMANNGNADLFVSIHSNASRSRWLSGFECYYLSEATDDNARAIAARENASLKYEKGSIAERSDSLETTLWDMELTEDRIVSRELAESLCDSVRDNLSARVGGVKSAKFYVLKFARTPAVLVETGYMSNRQEEDKLHDSAYLDRMAEALSDGILAYKREYERTDGFTN